MNFFEDFKNVVRQGFRLLANLAAFAAEKAVNVAKKLADAVRAYFVQLKKWSIRLFFAAVAPLVVVLPCLMFHAPLGWLYGTYTVWVVLLLAAELLLLTPIALAWKHLKHLPILGPDLQEWFGFIKTAVSYGLSFAIFTALFPIWRSPGTLPLLLLVVACWLTLPACYVSSFFKKIYPSVQAVQLLLLAGLLVLQMAFPRHLDQLKWSMASKLGNKLVSSVEQKEITSQWKSLQWFNNVGEPQVWFSGSPAPGYRLWAAPGFDQHSGKELIPVTDEKTKGQIVATLTEQDRIEQEAAAKRQATLDQQSKTEREALTNKLRLEQATRVTQQAEEARKAAVEQQRQLVKEREDFINRHIVPGQLTNSPQAQDVAVLVVSETRQPNNPVGLALVAALQARSANASASVFTPEFIADGLFEKAFPGSHGVLDRLELTNAADTILFARESVEYSPNEAMQGTMTARLKLELSALSASTHRQSQSHTTLATGAGFKEADARALAEERIVKLIAGKELDAFLSAILNKTQ